MGFYSGIQKFWVRILFSENRHQHKVLSPLSVLNSEAKQGCGLLHKQKGMGSFFGTSSVIGERWKYSAEM